ncbi:hypothetical protein [Viscerimonas tarda]
MSKAIQGKRIKNFSATIPNEIPPFGRNDSPIGGLKEEEVAASPPLPPLSLSPKRNRHSDQREESPAHISNFTEGISSKFFHAFTLQSYYALPICDKVYFAALVKRRFHLTFPLNQPLSLFNDSQINKGFPTT